MCIHRQVPYTTCGTPATATVPVLHVRAPVHTFICTVQYRVVSVNCVKVHYSTLPWFTRFTVTVVLHTRVVVSINISVPGYTYYMYVCMYVEVPVLPWKVVYMNICNNTCTFLYSVECLAVVHVCIYRYTAFLLSLFRHVCVRALFKL